MRKLVEYRLYLDLQRGWRITMPNLEQVGLLRVPTSRCPRSPPTRASADACPPAGGDEHREELCQIVSTVRKVLAVGVDCLTETGFEHIQRQSSQDLTGAWAMPPNACGPNQSRGNLARVVALTTSSQPVPGLTRVRRRRNQTESLR